MKKADYIRGSNEREDEARWDICVSMCVDIPHWKWYEEGILQVLYKIVAEGNQQMREKAINITRICETERKRKRMSVCSTHCGTMLSYV